MKKSPIPIIRIIDRTTGEVSVPRVRRGAYGPPPALDAPEGRAPWVVAAARGFHAMKKGQS